MSIVHNDIFGNELEFIGFSIVPHCLNINRPECVIYQVRGLLKNEYDFICIDNGDADTRLIANFFNEEEADALRDKLNILLEGENNGRTC
jgi:hypothetical protein